MSGKPSGGDKKEAVKTMIRRLHSGEDPKKVKEECKDVLRDLEPHEIGMIEQELIEEGMKVEEVQRMCGAHLALLKENVEKAGPKVPDWHPIHILMDEHNIMLDFSSNLRDLLGGLGGADPSKEQREKLEDIVHHFKESESHYLREENVLFPHLEKHGITQPPAIMWMEHDKIREIKKDIYNLVDQGAHAKAGKDLKDLGQLAITLSEALSDHFYKENNVLYPMGLNAIEDKEWKDIRTEFDELGYCCFTPTPAGLDAEKEMEKVPAAEVKTASEGGEEGMVALETGNMTPEEMQALFNSLPVDITFVDKDDKVRFFSEGKDRIFVRTRSVIGRKVQNCHPQKSVHVVNEILEDFRNGKRESAEFWINMKGRMIYIRYFPVRNPKGEYLGCLEITQDITDVKKIEGEKRLL
jgi:PAS domain S-box-containing protein